MLPKNNSTFSSKKHRLSGLLAGALIAIPYSAPAEPSAKISCVLQEASALVPKTTLVGPSGQLYAPTEEKTPRWQRATWGGVASKVLRAVRAGKQIYAIGNHTPIYRHSQNVWHMHSLPNRGPCTVSQGGAAVLMAVGKHVYRLAGNNWKRIASGKETISAVWGASAKRIYAATYNGSLFRIQSRSWRKIRHSLAQGEYITVIAGPAGRPPYALTSMHQVLRIKTTSSRPLSPPKTYEGQTLRPYLAAPFRKGVALIAHTGQEPTLILATGNLLQELFPLPTLEADDHFSLLHSDIHGNLLLGTHAGAVYIRTKDGTWIQGELLPPRSADTARSFPGSAPARTP